jgi:hypothetical protein
MDGFWAIFWLAVILKIPIVALLMIVWWAIRATPEPAAEHDDGEGGSRREPHPRDRPPHLPRRGPHGDPQPSPPERVRVTRRAPRVPDQPDR